MKRCSNCKQSKSEFEFHKDKNRISGLYCYCKACVSVKRRKSWLKCMRREQNYQSKKLYGISLEEKEKMLKNQNGQCVICSKQIENKDACIDHDHKTGKIRGILCQTCNRGLGCFYDNSSNLIRAAKYIDSSKGSILTPGKD